MLTHFSKDHYISADTKKIYRSHLPSTTVPVQTKEQDTNTPIPHAYLSSASHDRISWLQFQYESHFICNDLCGEPSRDIVCLIVTSKVPHRPLSKKAHPLYLHVDFFHRTHAVVIGGSTRGVHADPGDCGCGGCSNDNGKKVRQWTTRTQNCQPFL